MARTALPITVLPTAYALTPVVPTTAAADVTNGNTFVSTGREILYINNSSGTTAYTVTVSSVADPQGRTGDITNFTIAAGQTRFFQMFPTTGWQQPDGTIWVTGSNAALIFGVVRIP